LGTILALGGASAYGINIVFARTGRRCRHSGRFRRLLPRPADARRCSRRWIALLAAALACGAARRARGAGSLLGLASTLVGVAYISSIAFIPVTVAVVIFYTYPILIVLLSPMVDGGGRRPELLLIALVAFVGVACVVGPAFGTSTGAAWRLRPLASMLGHDHPVLRRHAHGAGRPP
jgi:drug/metabolite transporter (DMT)-like permease